jgi:DNA polymerase-3 subunit delta'
VISGQLAGEPWSALLSLARADGDAAADESRALIQADLDLLPAKERRKAERDGEELAKRAHRRAAARALDQGLQLIGLWLRDVACVGEGAEGVVHNCDRLEQLRADATTTSVHRLRVAVARVDETRASLVLNPTEELALEALAYRLAALLR